MPAPALQATSLLDLVATTLRDLGRGKITDLLTDTQEYPAVEQLMTRNSVKADSGVGIQFEVGMQHSGGASFVPMYNRDNLTQRDGVVQAQVDWRHAQVNWFIDLREIDMNRNPAKILDMLTWRRGQAMAAYAELLENAFWAFPSASDSLTPFGLPYWVTKNATEGFNGGIPTGYSSVANISPTTYPRWNNYTGQYTYATKDDLFRMARKGATKTGFKPIPNVNLPTTNTGNKMGWFTNYALLSLMEEALEAQNENLGNDLAPKDGKVMFRGAPVTWVPKLDSDTTNPLYGINWGVFKTWILKGWWMRQTTMEKTPGQHTVMSNYFDSTFNWVCYDRRRQQVYATGTTYPS